MARERYKAKGKLLSSAAMAKMREIAFNPSTPRMIINRLDKLHDDDAYELAAQKKRDRKLAKARAQMRKQKHAG